MELVEKFRVTLDFEVTVDQETGEVVTNCVKKSIDKSNFKSVDAPKPKTRKSKKEESPDPKLILEDNKYCLNTAAVELMGVEPDDKLDVGYKKQGKTMIPIIYKDDRKGNKVTKSLTVACRGSKNTELAKYGHEFDIVPSPTEGEFFLKSEDIEIEENVDNDNDESIDSIIDEDIQDLIDDKDANLTEISSFEFKL